jgi:hypothetical protein
VINFASTFIEMFSTTDQALTGIAILFAIGVIVTSLELLVERRRLWHEQGFLAWSIMGAGYSDRMQGPLGRCLNASCRPFVLDLLIGLRILASILLILFVAINANFVVPLVVTMLVHLIVHWRLRYMLDGSDKMSGLVGFTLLISAVFRDDHIIRVAALSFLTAQLTLCYAVAGLAKAATASWWNGRALQGTLGTVVFGVPTLHLFGVRFPMMTRAASWCVILFELSFPLALVGAPTVTVSYLIAGILFHVGVAAVMGFNSFLYFFVATYPAVCYTSSALRTGVLV